MSSELLAIAKSTCQSLAYWAKDLDRSAGRDTTSKNFTNAAALTNLGLPFGGYKGSAIAMMLEVLSGLSQAFFVLKTTRLFPQNTASVKH